jgi:sulfite reductase alpha subunit-like flavoprotein
MDPSEGNRRNTPKERPQSPGAGPESPAQDEGAALEVVTVKVFGRKCSFKSNRPELVKEIAKLAEEEMRLVKSQLPSLRQEMDLAAHAAFRLARRLIRCLRDFDELDLEAREAEDRVERLAERIDQSLRN